MDPVKTPDAKVATLGSKERIASHYEDESRLNELIALCGDLREALAGGPGRAQVVAEKAELITHGDRLSAGAGEVSTLLRAAFATALHEWKALRAQLVALGKS